MKITFLAPQLSMGGGTKVLAIHADYLASQGHVVTVVSLPHGKPRLLARLKNLFKYKPSIKPVSYFSNSNVKQQVIDRHRPMISSDLPEADVTIATWWETAEWLDKMDARVGKKVYFIQGHEVWNPIPMERSVKTYRSSLHKIVVSKWLQDVLQAEYGVENTDLVLNAVDKSIFNTVLREKQRVPTLGFLANIAPVKGLDVALQVVKMLNQLHPDLEVIAFGTQPLGSAFVGDMPKNIQFKLLPTASEIKAIYNQCDVWLAPSRSEGFNLTAMEAMACGTPVVSTKTGWPLEAIEDYKNGVLVDIDDVSALVDGVNWVLGLSDAEWKAVSKAAAQATEGVSWEKSAKMFEQVLKKQARSP